MMQKRFILIACCLLSVLPLQAGNPLIKARGAGKAAFGKVEVPAGRPNVAPSTQAVKAAMSEAARRQAPAATGTVRASAVKAKNPAVPYTPVLDPNVLNVPENDFLDPQLTRNAALTEIDGLVQTYGELTAEQKKLEEFGLEGGFGKSVLFGFIGNPKDGNGTSVTVIKTHYNGQDEIFGVIATHTLPESVYVYDGSLHRSFEVALKQDDGTDVLVPAHVVQISPQSMLDISLVKFDPQAEKFLHPLELSDGSNELDELLLSYGYADGQEAFEERVVQSNGFVSMRTTQNLDGNRRGFCGSPLVDLRGRVKGFHTGTVEGDGPIPDVSYGTHASFIKPLVEAYHSGGNGMYNLEINGKVLARLNVDEFISEFKVLDENGAVLTERTMGKFSQSAILSALDKYPQAAFLDITSHKAQWKLYDPDGQGRHLLVESRKPYDPTRRVQRYHFKTGQVEDL